MATKDFQPLGNKEKQTLRQFNAEDNVHELLVLLRNQEESPDKALLNETKCLLSLALDRTTMPPLPSIKSKTARRSSEENANETNTTSPAGEGSFATSTPSDDEVSDATQSPTFAAVSNTNAKRRLPSLGSREEAGTTSIPKPKPQSRKT